MNEEITNNENETLTENIPVTEAAAANSKGAAENKKSAPKKEKPKRKLSRKAENARLETLSAQMKKLTYIQNESMEKVREVTEHISEIKEEMRSIEIGRLLDICEKRNITLCELISLLENLPEGKKLTYSNYGILPSVPEKENGNDNG